MRRLLNLVIIGCTLIMANLPVGQTFAQYRSSRDSVLSMIHRQIDLLYVVGGDKNIEKIDHILRHIADADTTYLPAVLEYAEFLKHHDIKKSLKYYLIYQRGCTSSLHTYIDGLSRLSDVYYRMKEYNKDEELLASGLSLINALDKGAESREEYLNASAKIYTNAAQLYTATTRYDDAESAIVKAADAFNELLTIDSLQYLPDYTQLLTIAGDSFRRNKKMQKAKENLLEAFLLYESLYKESKRTYCAKYAWTSSALALLFKNEKDTVDAVKYYALAVEKYKEAMKYDPMAYGMFYARVLSNSAITLGEDADAEKAELLKEAIKVSEPFAHKYPELYMKECLTIASNFSSVALRTNLYDDIIDYLLPLTNEASSLDNAIKGKMRREIGIAYRYLAQTYLSIEDFEAGVNSLYLALDYLDEGVHFEWCQRILSRLVK